MIYLLLKVFIFVTTVCLATAIDEYCHSEIFQPRCASNEIIVIQEAFFGRRTMGKCLMEEGKPNESYLSDPQFIGCYADARDIVEPICSGRNSCDMIVSKIKAVTNCHNWLKLHLEISYVCLKIVPDNRHCTISISSDKLHLSNSQDSSASCGSKTNPWRIEALAGQKINITIVQFLGGAENKAYFELDSSDRRYQCSGKGQVMEKASRRIVKICLESKFKRFGKDYYVSDLNAVDVVLEKMNIKNGSGFVLGLEATGCSDLIPPADAWLKRTENEATIGCYSTRLRWQLKCLGQRWIGVIGNCNYGHELIEYHGTEEKVAPKSKADQTVAIITIGMCGVVASFLIACIGIICIKKYHTISKTKSVHLKMGNSAYNNGTLPILANKASNNDVKDNFQEGSQMNGTILPNDYHQQYYELDKAFISKDSVGQNDMEL